MYLAIFVTSIETKERWLTKKDNLPKVNNRKLLLLFWRNLASYKNDEEFDIHLAEMHYSPQLLENENIQKNFDNTWITKNNIGVERFSGLIFYSLSTRNNGTEAKHKILKHTLLNRVVDKELCHLLILLLIRFWQSSW